MAKLVYDGACREGEAATKHILQALGMLGLTTASTAVTLAVSDPPAWLDGNTYLLAVSCAFFAGMAELSAAIWVLSTGARSATAAAGVKKKTLVYGAAPLVAAVGLSAAALL